MEIWTLAAAGLVLAIASIAAWRRRRYAASLVASAWAALGAVAGHAVGQSLGADLGGALGVFFAFMGAGLGHWSLRHLMARAGADFEVARRWARAERGARTGELAAALAHEIKNPLTPIRGYARLLLRELDGVADTDRPLFQKGLGIIDAEAERIEHRVRQALVRARQHHPEAVNLPRLLEEVVGIVEVDPGVTRVDVALEDPLPPARAVEDGLQGALVNLFENAAEAMRDLPGPIEVSARRSGEHIQLLIRDRGPGLGERKSEELMKSFFTTKDTGTGLGLAVAKSAVESMGGHLDLRNRNDRPGAEAELRIPVWT
ncbi:MAG: ATP-binding protein [Myxococcota bacterium]